LSLRTARLALAAGAAVLVLAGCTDAADDTSDGESEPAEQAQSDGDTLSDLCRESRDTLVALTAELADLRSQLGQAQQSPERLAGLASQVDSAADQLLDGLRGLQASLAAVEVAEDKQAAVDEMTDLVAQRTVAYQAFADTAVAALASGDQAQISALVPALVTLQQEVAPLEQRQTELAIQLGAPACRAGRANASSTTSTTSTTVGG
jgi:small-conductance mechanosensitive channel